MTCGTQRSTRIAVTALVAVAAALAAAPGFSSLLPKISSVTIDRTAHLGSGGEAVVTGRITCTQGARFHVYIWVIERLRGALAKRPPASAATPGAPTPGAATPGTGSPPTSSVACSNTVQPWSVTVVGSGSHPAGLIKGRAEACVTVTLGRHYLYVDLVQTCGTIVVV